MIYLVVRHVSSRHAETGEQIFHRRNSEGRIDRSIGGYGHGRFCYCLLIHGETTYNTREEADARAAELESRYPDDVAWSIGVETPK